MCENPKMTSTENTKMSENLQAELQAALERWIEVCRSKNVALIMTCYAEDVVAYDAVGPLRFVGRPAYQAHWQACMEMCSGAALFEVHQPTFFLSADLAVVHYLLHCGGTDDKGQAHNSWMRASQCLRRSEGRWLIVHEHLSAPCDMESGKASFDLQP